MTAPVRLHAAKTKPYLDLMALTMKGVKNARRKFHSQLLAVESAPWRARVRVGNVSPMRIQMPLLACEEVTEKSGEGTRYARCPGHGVSEDEETCRDDHHCARK